MPTSEARIQANQANSLKSSGPRTDEGKARSRGNAVKHGLTGAGIVLPVEEAAEVDRLQRSFEAELKPSGQVGRTLVRRIALMTVRMDRSVVHETAALSEHVRQAVADFDAEWPAEEGQDDPDREQMRVETAKRALFDPSREATLARKYEASAERCFFRSLKELRQVEKEARATASGPDSGAVHSSLGSFLPEETLLSAPAEIAPRPVATASKPSPKPVPNPPISPKTPVGVWSDIPFAIGRAG